MIDTLSLAKQILKDLYIKYSERGAISIYLWGSIITDDFSPETSDVDAVAIAKDDLSLEEERVINDILTHSGVKDFKIRFVYLSEFNGGEARSNLARSINPKLLLNDFKYWQHVAGKKFTQADFAMPDASLSELVQIVSRELRQRYIPELETKPENYKYFLKACARAVYYFQQIRLNKTWPFSYTALAAHASPDDHEIVEAILKLKESNWDYQLFQRLAPFIVSEIMNII